MLYTIAEEKLMLLESYENGNHAEREALEKLYGKEQLINGLRNRNELMSDHWMSENSKPCPRCHIPIVVISFINYNCAFENTFTCFITLVWRKTVDATKCTAESARWNFVGCVWRNLIILRTLIFILGTRIPNAFLPCMPDNSDAKIKNLINKTIFKCPSGNWPYLNTDANDWKNKRDWKFNKFTWATLNFLHFFVSE